MENITLNITEAPENVALNIEECLSRVYTDGITITGTGRPTSPLTAVTSAGDMLRSTYDPTNVNADAFDMENMIEGAAKKIPLIFFYIVSRINLGDDRTARTAIGKKGGFYFGGKEVRRDRFGCLWRNAMSQDPALYLSGIGFPLFHVLIIARIAARVKRGDRGQRYFLTLFPLS